MNTRKIPEIVDREIESWLDGYALDEREQMRAVIAEVVNGVLKPFASVAAVLRPIHAETCGRSTSANPPCTCGAYDRLQECHELIALGRAAAKPT